MNLARRDLLGQATAMHPDRLHDHRPVPDRPRAGQRGQDQEGDLRRAAVAATPETFTLAGFQTVLAQGDFTLYFGNSLIVTVVSLA